MMRDCECAPAVSVHADDDFLLEEEIPVGRLYQPKSPLPATPGKTETNVVHTRVRRLPDMGRPSHKPLVMPAPRDPDQSQWARELQQSINNNSRETQILCGKLGSFNSVMETLSGKVQQLNDNLAALNTSDVPRSEEAVSQVEATRAMTEALVETTTHLKTLKFPVPEGPPGYQGRSPDREVSSAFSRLSRRIQIPRRQERPYWR